MFETTMYANHYYGSKKSDVDEVLLSGKHVLTVMDICGAMALKTNFRSVITVYVKRDRRQLLADILNKPSSVDDKINRLLAIEGETQNAEICDYVLEVDDFDKAADKVLEVLEIK